MKLPKGMNAERKMRRESKEYNSYILIGDDEEELRERQRKLMEEPNCVDVAMLKLQKAIDEQAFEFEARKRGYVKAVHAHWTKEGKCSRCGWARATDSVTDHLVEDDNKHCYNCGAIMDEEVKNGK